MRFANHYILLLFTFYSVPTFWNWACIHFLSLDNFQSKKTLEASEKPMIYFT